MLTKAILPIYEHLRACEDPGALLTAAAGLAAAACGFDRAVVAAVSDGVIRAPLRCPPSAERVHEALLGAPVDLRTGPGAVSPELAAKAGLGHHTCAWIAPDGVQLALLIVDRRRRPVGPEDIVAATNVAAVIAMAVESAILRRRVRAFTREVQQFGALARGTPGELLDGAPVLPSGHGTGVPLAAPTPRETPRLSPQERRVATLLMDGRANRDIAEALLISPETVRTHVTSIRRKLGAANRVEVISLLLQMSR